MTTCHSAEGWPSWCSDRSVKTDLFTIFSLGPWDSQYAPLWTHKDQNPFFPFPRVNNNLLICSVRNKKKINFTLCFHPRWNIFWNDTLRCSCPLYSGYWKPLCILVSSIVTMGTQASSLDLHMDILAFLTWLYVMSCLEKWFWQKRWNIVHTVIELIIFRWFMFFNWLLVRLLVLLWTINSVSKFIFPLFM